MRRPSFSRRSPCVVIATAAAVAPLTMQELQVALKVAVGATNREVATALFLSPKTIEAHLSRVYSKLGLRSRTELAHRFAHDSGEPGFPGNCGDSELVCSAVVGIADGAENG